MEDLNKYKIEVIVSLDQMKSMSDEWNGLLTKSTANTVFLTWEWQFAWAQCFLNDKRELFVIVIRSEEQLVGIAPFYIERGDTLSIRSRQIKFLGYPESESDYLDVFIRQGKEKEVTSVIYDFLWKKAFDKWECITLGDIPSNSLFLLHMSEILEQEGKCMLARQESFCPVASLPAKKEDYFAGLTSNRRQQFYRHLRVLERVGPTEYHSFSDENIHDAMDEFFCLYQTRHDLDDDHLRRLIETLVTVSGKNHLLQIDLLRSNGKSIAGLLHLSYEDSLFMYLMAIDTTFNPKISIGNILVGLSLSKAIEDGKSKYDFLKGSEGYKFHWASSGRSSMNVFICLRKIAPILHVAGHFVRDLGKMILR